MPKYIIEMDAPMSCDGCLFLGYGFKRSMCNISRKELETDIGQQITHPPYGVKCPLKESVWRTSYTIEALYKSESKWKRMDYREYGNLEEAVGACVLNRNANILETRVVETLVPPKDELSTVVWRSQDV